MKSSLVAIVFFAVMLVGSVLYTVKGKGRSLFSFLVNLEVEYVLVGVIMYFVADTFGMPHPVDLDRFLHVLLVFMGLMVGSHYGIQLLMKVPTRVHAVIGVIYIAGLVAISVALFIAGTPSPVVAAVMLNGLMPYAPQLAMRLLQVPSERVFTSSLIASLFPLFSLTAYAFAVAVYRFTPADYATTLAPALVAAALFASYGQARQRKTLHLVTIIFVVVLAGLARFGSVSPLVLGFLVGLAIANGHWGATFAALTASFERFLYIFFGVVTGIALAMNAPGSWKTIAVGVGVIACLWLARGPFSGWLVRVMLPAKNELVAISSIGMLPAAMLLDAWLILDLPGLGALFVAFFVMNLAGDTLTWLEVRRAARTA